MSTKIPQIEIVFETSDCLFINKPAGISVHGDGKTDEVTLADVLVAQYPFLAEVGEPLEITHGGETISVMKPGMMHRLDKDTSGVMIIAKTQSAYEFLKTQFKERHVEKIYHAFVYGWIKEDTQMIAAPIGRDTGDIRRWTTGRAMRGVPREAQTQITVMSRFGDLPYEGKGSTEEGTYSFVEARPKTGRTHQIRVHLRAINHPIVSDTLYASKRPKALGFERQALHARSLTITLPEGKQVTIEAPYPEDFINAVKLAERQPLC